MLRQSLISNLVRAAVVALTLAAASLTTAVRAEKANLSAAEIAALERQLAQSEAAFAKAKPDSKTQMQYVLTAAKLVKHYMISGDAQKTVPLTEKVLAIVEQMFGPDHGNVATFIEATASAYEMQNRFAEAEKLRKRAIAINERAFGAESLNVANSLQGMALLYNLQDRKDLALDFALRAVAIVEKDPTANGLLRATLLSRVASIHMSRKSYVEAEPLVKQALAILDTDKTIDKTAANVLKISCLQSLAQSYVSREMYEQARSILDRAVALSSETLGPRHFMTVTMLMSSALQFIEQNQLDDGERLLKQALSINEKNVAMRGLLAQNYSGLGLIATRREKWPDAYAYLSNASKLSIALDQVAITGGMAPSQNSAASNAEIYRLHAVAAYRLAGTGTRDAEALRDEAFQLSQRAERSSAAGALAQMAARLSAGDGALAQMIRERQDLANEWANLDKALEQAMARPEAERNAADEKSAGTRMTAISSRLEEIDARIAKDFPGFAKVSDPAPMPIAQVQSLLRPNEVMIVTAQRAKQSLVWAIGQNTVDWHLVPSGDDQLARDIQTLRCGLDDTAWQGDGAAACSQLTGKTWRAGEPLPFDIKHAFHLYKTWFRHFESMTEGAHLIFVTSGLWSTVPLHVLVTAPPAQGFLQSADEYADAAWLAKRNAITILPSAASLAALRATATPSRAASPYLGIANPLLTGAGDRFGDLAKTAKAFNTCAAANQAEKKAASLASLSPRVVAPAVPQGGLANSDFIRQQPPLPETAQEVCAVASDFGSGEAGVRLAERATETEIKQLGKSGALSNYRIVHFATHGSLPGQVAGTTEPGLLLTPPQKATALDDGYLTASEIAELKLDADWVILSACNTAGAGRPGAEALSGLARAFFYAQARSVLASHWNVDSRATVALIAMTASALRDEPGIGRAEAVRRAMQGLISNSQSGRSHPKYWAPFVLIGEGGREP